MSSFMETDDNMEDSGFDSDPKNLYNGLKTSPCKTVPEPWEVEEEEEESESFIDLAQPKSDPEVALSGSESDTKQPPNVHIAVPETSALKALQKSADLKKKIERQREAARKSPKQVVDQQPRGVKGSLMSRSRLVVPTKHEAPSAAPDQQPLVMLETDDSEDDFLNMGLSKDKQNEITQQLIKDGYNLDLEPDDEDLDLIPPRPINERCICCNTQVNCCVQ